jgi:hypothetical protein
MRSASDVEHEPKSPLPHNFPAPTIRPFSLGLIDEKEKEAIQSVAACRRMASGKFPEIHSGGVDAEVGTGTSTRCFLNGGHISNGTDSNSDKSAGMSRSG